MVNRGLTGPLFFLSHDEQIGVFIITFVANDTVYIFFRFLYGPTSQTSPEFSNDFRLSDAYLHRIAFGMQEQRQTIRHAQYDNQKWHQLP